MSPGPSSRENQSKTFLATLQNILAVLEDEVSPAIQDNTYIRLVNELQILYNIHNGTNGTNGTNNTSALNSNSNSNSNNISNVTNFSNISNFSNVLPALETMYDAMSYTQRNRAYENNNYTNLMNTARSFWNAMSLDEQRDYRTNMGQPEIEFGGPVHRIIYPRS
jgi:hypothetical protein